MGIVKRGKEMPKKHYCPTHDKECKTVLVMPKRRTQFNCPEGCTFGRNETVLKYPPGSER